MAIFSKTEVTAQGHRYISKVLSGKTKFKFTSVKAGDGKYTGDVLDLTGLVNFRLDGAITGVTPMGLYTELDCIFTNQNLEAYMDFREIGVYADDPDDGEILFAYTNADDYPDPIGPFNGVFLTEEQFTINVYTANIADISATISTTTFAGQVSYNNKGSGLKAENVQGAIDEMSELHPLGATFNHGLNAYIDVNVIEFDAGYGILPYGEGPYGGTGGRQLRSRVEYLTRNSVRVLTEKDYGAVKSVDVTEFNEYLVTFTGNTYSLVIVPMKSGGGYGGAPPILPAPGQPVTTVRAALQSEGADADGTLQSESGALNEMYLSTEK